MMTHRIYPRRRRPSHVPLAVLAVLCLTLAVALLLQLFLHFRLQKTEAQESEAFTTTSATNTGATVVITASNWMYREHLANFACNLRNLGIKNGPLVYALDRKISSFSHQLGLSSVLLSDEDGDDVQPGKFERDGNRSFNVITKRKLEAVGNALRGGLNVLLSDADVFWCGDAVKEVENMGEEYQGADVLIMAEAWYRSLNSGFYYVRSGDRSIKLFNELEKRNDIGAHDQDVVNGVFCSEEYGGKRIEGVYGGDVPFWCESHGAKIRVLPSRRFASGKESYGGMEVFKKGRRELEEMCRMGEFVVLHNNFIRANKKKARSVTKGMWFVEFRVGVPVCLEEAVEGTALAQRTCGKYC